MGSSVGAASILIALPEMPRLTAVIAENPMASFQQLIREAPQSQGLPRWATDLLIDTAMARGRFDGLLSAEHSLPLVKSTPIYFIHSKMDEVVSYKQTQALADLYVGPKTVWFPDKGGHAAIWDADPAEYEKRLAAFLESVRYEDAQPPEAKSPTIKWSRVIHRFAWRSVFHPGGPVNDDREAVAAFGGGPKGHH